MSYYAKHVFMCTNQRQGDEKCCNQADAAVLCQYLKAQIKTLNLNGKNQIRVSSAGCMGRCAEGPVLVIYPEGIWYTYNTEADIDEIVNRYLIANEVVSHLLLPE